MTEISLSELENWLFDVKKELLVCGVDLGNVMVSVNRIEGKQLLNVKLDGKIEATKVW